MHEAGSSQFTVHWLPGLHVIEQPVGHASIVHVLP